MTEQVAFPKYLDITKVRILKAKETKHYVSKLNLLKLNKNRMWKYYSYKIKDFRKLCFTMVSRNKISNYSCGNYLHKKGSYACPEHVKESIIHHKKDCNHLGCPICYDSAGSRRAKKVVGRLMGIKLSAYQEKINLGKLTHVSLNPEKSVRIFSYDEFKELRNKAIAFAKSINIWGGVMFHHPFRIDELNQELYESHHFHTLCFGYMAESKTFEFEGITWRYQNHGRISNRKDLEKVVNYNLSHSGLFYRTLYRKEKLKKTRIRTNQHYNSYVYYGICSPAVSNLLGVEKVESVSECPICKQELFKIESGIKIPMINNRLSELHLENCYGLESPVKYLEIGSSENFSCECEYCQSRKNKDVQDVKNNLYVEHYGVDKWRSVIIMSEGVKFNKELWLMDFYYKYFFKFKNIEKIRGIIN